MGFRLNPKWVFSLHQHFPSNSSSSSSPSSPFSLPFSYSLTVKIPEASFVSTRSSFLSSVNEDDGVRGKDPLKVCGCASGTQYISENVYIELKDPKIKMDTGSVGEQRFSEAKARLSCSKLQYNILMKNLFALEETFVASDSLNLEKDIMLHLGRLGALELFSSCLSRMCSSSNASCLSDMGENSLRTKASDQTGEIVVSSRKEVERKERSESVKAGNSDMRSCLTINSRSMSNNITPQDAFRMRRSSKSRKKRAAISRDEAEMSTGIKIVANLDRIKMKLEKESGKVASLSSWAEAAGMNKKLLLHNLHFGWYCRDELLKSSRSLVLFISRNYRGLGIAHEDLIQAGNVGVLQGAERFDHTRGYKFSTYVQYWIRKSMSMTVSQHARGIHIPSSMNQTMNKIKRVRKTLKTSRGVKHPSDAEIAKLTGLSLKKIQGANQCLRVVGSIDQKVGDCMTMKFLELTPDTNIESPEEIVMRRSASREVRDLLERLEPREKQVMILRYGLSDYRPKSLEEIGRLLQVSKEWIRRIERRAMTKLRDQPTAGDLRYYLER